MKKLLASTLTLSLVLGTPTMLSQAKETTKAHTSKLAKTIEETELVSPTSSAKNYKVETVEKTIKTLDKVSVKTDFLKTTNLKLSKEVKAKLTQDTKYMIKYYANNNFAKYKKSYGQDSEVTVEYSIKRNEKGIFSLRAKVYFENKVKKHKQFQGSMNFNYNLNKKNLTYSFEDNYAKGITDAKIQSFLKQETKRVFGKSVGYPADALNAFYVEKTGAVVVTYPGKYFNDKANNVYMVRIPSSYFKN